MKRNCAASSSVALLMALQLGACGGGATSPGGGTLAALGLRKPPPIPEAQLPPRKVALHLHAAPRLNVDRRGQALALLVRVYKLRDRAAFDSAPYAAFLSAQTEREALGADLVDVKEVTLVPGQRLDLDEQLARDAGWLGVVALFHAPAERRWRVAFAAADAEQGGVTLGLHACALSVGSGAVPSDGPLKPLSLVRCQ